MKVFILTDMEGISGISKFEQMSNRLQTDRDPWALERLMVDVNAAVRGAFDGGATEVYVLDGHGGGENFIKELLDKRAIQTKDVVVGVKDADAVFLVGAHAMAGTENAFLEHTQSSVAWHNYYINGRPCGEIGQDAVIAGAYNAPVVMVSGDVAACAEARALLGNICTAVVKYAEGRNNAECLPDEEAEQLIYETARKAMGLVGKAKPYKVRLPMELILEFNRTDYCDAAAKAGTAERLDGRTLRRYVDKVETFWDLMV